MIKTVYAVEDGGRWWLIEDDDGLLHWHPFPGKTETEMVISDLCMEIQHSKWLEQISNDVYYQRYKVAFSGLPGSRPEATKPSPKHKGWLEWREKDED